MKSLIKTIGGIAASLLLAAGLHGAASKLDPMTHVAGLQNPENISTNQGTITADPCMPCNIED